MNQNDDAMAFESDNFILDGAKKISRAENIAGVIRDGIERGYWKPDDRINDQELSERLGVSRLTVREALSRLVERRILEKKHWKGYTVRKLSWEDIENIIDVRLSLEELALKNGMAKNPGTLIQELTAAIGTCRKLLADGDYQSFFTADYLFHEVLYRQSGNPWIEDILSDLHLVINLIRHISQADRVQEVAEISIRDHESILQAVRDGQGNVAASRLREHLNNHRERVRREYAAQESDPKQGPAAS
jgi:DNA-binding GntR family transcriptional regulator